MRICFKMVDFPDSPAPGMKSVKLLEGGGGGGGGGQTADPAGRLV